MEVYKSVKIPSNVPGIGYTLRHRAVVEALINYYCKRALLKRDGNGESFTKQDFIIMRGRAVCHDMDKVCTSLCYPQLTADYFHRIFNGHHMECIFEPQEKSKYDWMEMIFDFESARYTKPDKGKCAFEMATTFYKPYFNYFRPYLQLFGFTSVNHDLVPEVKEFVKTTVTEEDLMGAILNYIHTTRIHQLEYTSRNDDVGYTAATGKAVLGRDRRGAYHKHNYQRPSNYVASNAFASGLEMIHGNLQVSLFDIDMLCSMSVANTQELERANKGVQQYLAANKLQR